MTNLLTRRFIDKREYYVVNTYEGERFFRRFTDALRFINSPPLPVSEGANRRITIKHRVKFWRGRPDPDPD